MAVIPVMGASLCSLKKNLSCNMNVCSSRSLTSFVHFCVLLLKYCLNPLKHVSLQTSGIFFGGRGENVQKITMNCTDCTF